MKVAIFNSVADNYGSSKICLQILNVLKRKGFNINCFVRFNYLNPEKQYAKEIIFPLLVVSKFKLNPIFSILKFIYEFFYFIIIHIRIIISSDIIYCNTLGTLPIAVLSKILGKFVIIHIHESNEFGSNLKIVFSKIILFFSNKIICVSNSTANDFLLQNSSSVFIIKNGIPDIKFNEYDNLRNYDILFLGRLTKKKGFDLFIRYLHFLDHKIFFKNNRLSVAIAGKGITGDLDYLNIIKHSNFNNIDLEYLGEVESTAEIFNRSKIVCVLSVYSDPYPTVILEALRSGCSVITSTKGGGKEALPSYYDGLLINNNEVAFFNVFKKLYKNWSEVGCIVKENRNIYLNNHTLQNFENNLIKVICNEI